jgi:hypothetical protein
LEDLGSIREVQDQWRALVFTVMNIRVLLRWGIYLQFEGLSTSPEEPYSCGSRCSSFGHSAVVGLGTETRSGEVLRMRNLIFTSSDTGRQPRLVSQTR